MAEGGGERAALQLAGELARRQFTVDLVLASVTGPLVSSIPEGVRVIDLGGVRVIGSVAPLAKYLRRERPVGMASFLNHANVAAVWARRATRGTRIVVVEQNHLSVAAANGSTRRDRLLPLFVRRSYPWADAIVAVSEGVAADLCRHAKLDPDRVRVIFNPIVSYDIGDKAAAPLDHAWFGAEVPVLVAVGRLRPQKDFGTLLEALALVREERPARLVVLGEGSERGPLEAMARRLGIAADVDLHGSTANPYAFMARASAFVLSSRWEGLPTVLVEALRCGAPVVATDCPSGPREILAGGAYGRLVSVQDPHALAAGILDALAGHVQRPPEQSWRPYEVRTVVDSYIPLLIGKG